MAVSDNDLQEMNRLISCGKKISDLARQFPQYDYLDIYWSVNDYSILGKKRSVTNRIEKLRSSTISNDEKEQILNEIQETVNDLYEMLKANGEKLVEIGQIING